MIAALQTVLVRRTVREMQVARGANPDVPKPMINILFILPYSIPYVRRVNEEYDL